MPSVALWLSLLAAVSAPLVATAHSVIDTQAVGAGAVEAAATVTPLTTGTLTTDESLAVDQVFAYSGLDLVDDSEDPHGRSLLRARRRRGTSRASPKTPSKRKSPKKKSPPPKNPRGKKKSPPKKRSPPKKKSPKKNSSAPKQGFAGSGGGSARRKGSGKAIGVAKKAHGTYFSGMGTPTGGCGVPPGKAYDDQGRQLPFVALNTNSEFDNGSNCGRWVEITLKENCVGGGNSAYSICNGGRFLADGMTGDKIYGYVMDSCADSNFWCQSDTYHLDISSSYLTALGYIGGSTGSKMWNGRKIEWKYMTGAPSQWKMSNPKFMWKKGSKWIPNGKGFYGSIIIYNMDNGIGSVLQQMGGSWKPMKQLNHLGNMWVVERPPDSVYRQPRGGEGQSITMRVLDVNGASYGIFKCPWKCGGSVCGSEVDVNCQKIG